MSNVTITVDGREVVNRDCASFECEETAAGVLEARGTFAAVDMPTLPTGTILEMVNDCQHEEQMAGGEILQWPGCEDDVVAHIRGYCLQCGQVLENT